MKTILTLTFSFIVILNAEAQDYFWVGGGGNWTDVNHWATSSGGSTFHTEVPDSTSNIFFDENSFSNEGEKVIYDQTGLSCNNITISGTELKPEFKFSDFYDEFIIHGNITFKSEVSWQIQYNIMVGNESSKIDIALPGFYGALQCQSKDSLAEFNLVADFVAIDLQIYNGHFDTKGYDLTVGEFSVGKTLNDGSPSATLHDSEINSRSTIIREFCHFDAGTSQIYVTDPPGATSVLFFGGGHDFHHVTFGGKIDRIKDDNHFVKFTAMPGSTLSLEDGHIQTAEQFVFDGISSAPISIDSREEGVAAHFVQNTGTVEGNYLTLKDNTASGEAEFIASNSIDAGNVEGWILEAVTPHNYYWVGNSGSWSELSHWAKSSGGTEFYAELPRAIDNVYFDENSVLENSALITIDVAVLNVLDLSLQGLRSGTVIRSTSAVDNLFNIYGNVVFSEGLQLNFDEVFFPGDTLQTLTSNGSNWGSGSKLNFSSNSQIELIDGIYAYDLSISNGVFNSNGKEIQVAKNFKLTTLDDPIINFDASRITVNNWLPSESVDLSLNETEIICSGIFYGEGFTYKDLTLTGRNWLYGPLHANALEFQAGSEILILPGDTIYFDDLVLNGTESDSITIASREEGQAAYLHSEEGEVNGEYLIIRDNHALGGAQFNARNSFVDQSNVVGWNNIQTNVVEAEDLAHSFYPNPVRDYLNVRLVDGHFQDFSIFDSMGREMYRHSKKATGFTRISVLDWPAGIYHVSAIDKTWNRKFLVVKAN